MTEPVNPFQTIYEEWSSGGTDWPLTAPVPPATAASAPQPVYYPQPFQPAPVPPGGVFPGRPASHYFEQSVHRASFDTYRKQKQEYYKLARTGPNWTEDDEHQLVDQLHQDWFGEPWMGVTWMYPDLNLDALPTIPMRKRELAPFKIAYDTFAEIKLRLLNTVISVKGHPFFVGKIKRLPNCDFHLALLDDPGSANYQVVKYSDLVDLRSVPPMYVHTKYTGWLRRHPGRVYQQGLNRNNTSIWDVSGQALLCNLDTSTLLRGLKNRSTRKWDETVSSLVKGGEISSIRLSDDIAVRSWDDKILACYRGRSLGYVQDNDILVEDEDDLLQSWIERSAKAVGLELHS